MKGFMAKFSKDQAKKLKDMKFDVDALASRRLPYERLDQLVTELRWGAVGPPQASSVSEPLILASLPR